METQQTLTFSVVAITDLCFNNSQPTPNNLPLEYVHTIGAVNDKLSLYRPPSLCGPWGLDVNFGALAGKATVDTE